MKSAPLFVSFHRRGNTGGEGPCPGVTTWLWTSLWRSQCPARAGGGVGVSGQDRGPARGSVLHLWNEEGLTSLPCLPLPLRIEGAGLGLGFGAPEVAPTLLPPAVTVPAPLPRPHSCPGRTDLRGPWMMGKGRSVMARTPRGLCRSVLRVPRSGKPAAVSRGLASGSLERSGDVVKNGAPCPNQH